MRFLHLTLCEYLAARELREVDQCRLLSVIRLVIEAERASRPQRLLEVAVFAASLVGRDQRNALVSEILSADDASTRLVLRIIRDNESSDDLLFGALERVVSAIRHTGDVNPHLVEVRLLLQCFSNALANAGPQSKAKLLGIRHVVSRLADNIEDFEKMFPTLLAVDPSMAIEEARARGVAARVQTVPVLVEAMQDTEVVNYAITQLRGGVGRWGVALAEAALRYPLVAQILFENKAAYSFADSRTSDVSGSSMENSWHRIDFLRGTLYAEVLDFAGMNFSADLECGPMLLVPLLHYGPLRLTDPDGGNAPLRVILNLYSGRVSIRTRHPDLQDSGTIIAIFSEDGVIDAWGPPSLYGRKVDSLQVGVPTRVGDNKVPSYDYVLIPAATFSLSLPFQVFRCYADDCVVPVKDLDIQNILTRSGLSEDYFRRTPRKMSWIMRRRYRLKAKMIREIR